MNNKDWLLHTGQGNFEAVQLMLQAIDPQKIALECSPRHVQSVIEDLRAVALGMAIDLSAQPKREPLPERMTYEAETLLSNESFRDAFRLGWQQAECAHGIGGEE